MARYLMLPVAAFEDVKLVARHLEFSCNELEETDPRRVAARRLLELIKRHEETYVERH